MKSFFITTALLLTLALSLPAQADTITGTAVQNRYWSSFSLVTPEGVAIAGSIEQLGLPTLWVDPSTGRFELRFNASNEPNINCSQQNWQLCGQALILSPVTGHLDLLHNWGPGGNTVAPPQTVVVHSSGSIEYWYRTEDLAVHHNKIDSVLMQFTLVIPDMMLIPIDGVAIGSYSMFAQFPDPTPEPASLLMLVGALGVLGARFSHLGRRTRDPRVRR